MAYFPPAYEGREHYVFISYAHKDSDRVLPIICMMHEHGIRVWYDGGIEWGEKWADVVGAHIRNCTYAICFLSPAFLNSKDCLNEIHMAGEENKGPLIAFLEQVQLPPGMQLNFGRSHKLLRSRYNSEADFHRAIINSDALADCRAPIPENSRQPVAVEKRPSAPVPARTTAAVDSPAQVFQKGLALYDKENYAAAYPLFAEAARRDNSGAMYYLGRCFEYGQGVSKSLDNALMWYEKAGKTQHLAALSSLRRINQEKKKAQSAAASGKQAVPAPVSAEALPAQVPLSTSESRSGDELFLVGLESYTKRDYSAAVAMFLKAVQQGNTRAMYYLGICYEYGRGVPKQCSSALEWYRRAEEKGHWDARNARVRLERETVISRKPQPKAGTGGASVSPSPKELNASAQESAEEIFQAGLIHYNKGDYAASIPFFETSAGLNNPKAMFYLGLCNEFGQGMPKRIFRAAEWYRKGAELNHTQSKDAVKRLKLHGWTV